MNEVVQRPRESAKRPMDAQKEEHDERAGRKPERTVDDALNETKSSEHGARYPEWSMLARDPAAGDAATVGSRSHTIDADRLPCDV